MSYTNVVGDMMVTVVCESNPQEFYDMYHDKIEEDIKASGYEPRTDLENVVIKAVLHFDCDDNFGEYDPSTGYGGYIRTLQDFFTYVNDCGGYSAFDYKV